MNNNVDSEIKRLEASLEQLKKERELEKQQREAEAQPEQWEPKGGDYEIYGDLETGTNAPQESYRLAGSQRPTRELAQTAAKELRKFHRLLAYVHEHAPGHDVSGEGYSVYKSAGEYSKVFNDGDQDLGAITMPRDVAEKLADDLNSGRVVL